MNTSTVFKNVCQSLISEGEKLFFSYCSFNNVSGNNSFQY